MEQKAGEQDTKSWRTDIIGKSQISCTLKLPSLWKNDIKLWFIQTESNFKISRTTNDNTKYNNLIAVINHKILTAISNILFNLMNTARYNM